MGRKKRPAMTGLVALGARLKQLRHKAGISQMKLAKLIGFDPAHGYKYILRLEKGQVPNPTLRTIAACLEACGMSWQDVTDVLPSTGVSSLAGSAPKPKAEERMPETVSPAPESSIANRQSSVPAPPRRKDSRPMREQLRSQRIEQRTLRTQRFWSAVQRSTEASHGLLRSLRIPTNLHRGYLSFVRSCCSTLDAFESSRPGTVERELDRLVQPAVTQGLDRKVLTQIQVACIQAFRSQPNA
jgi:transcriptional regulator with XRE-family HTH domain